MKKSLFNLGAHLDMESSIEVPANILLDGCDIDMTALHFDEDAIVAAELEIFQNEVDLEVATQAVSDFESIEVTLSATLATGGLKDKNSIIAMQQFYNRVSAPFGSHAVAIPDMESFEAVGGSETETAVMISSVKEMASAGYKAVKALIQRIIDSAIAFYKQHFSLAGRTKKALKSLEAKAKSATGKPVESNVKVGSPNLLDGDIVELTKYIKSVASNKDLESALSDFAKVISGVKSDDIQNGISAVDAAEVKIREAAAKQFETTKQAVVHEKDTGYFSKILERMIPGSATVRVFLPKSDSDLVTKVEIDFTGDSKAKKEAKALTAKEIVQATSDAASLLDAYEALSKISERMAGGLKDLIKAADSANKELKDADAVEARKLGAKIKNLKSYASLGTAANQALLKHSASVAAAYGGYAKASISNLKSDKKKEDKKEDKEEK